MAEAELARSSLESHGASSAAPSRGRSALELVAVAVLLFSPAAVRLMGAGALSEAGLWLPSGVAVAAVVRFGPRALGLIAACAVGVRLYLGYPTYMIAPGALGAVAEAAFGWWLVRRLALDAAFARLRDVFALALVSALAPLPSMATALVTRAVVGIEDPLAFSWDGWWRMNALGVLLGAPLVTTWTRVEWSRVRPRALLEGLVAAALLLLTTLVVLALGERATSILAFVVALPTVIYAAVRWGPLGAVSLASLGGLAVAVGADRGFGPIVALDPEQRSITLHVFTFALALVPLLVGAVIAERENAVESRVRADAARDALQRVLPDVACRLAPDGRVLDVYWPHEERGMARHDALRGRSLFEHVERADARELQRALGEALEGGAVRACEVEFDWGGRRRTCEARFVRDGEGHALCLLRDIADRKFDERLVELQARVLESIARGKPSFETLTLLVEGIEQLGDGAMASLLVLEGRRLWTGVAPSLPDSYNRAIDGLEIGPGVGSCGTAAHEGRSVIVSDIESDVLWAPYRELARAHALRACWSMPVRGADGAVLGTFALYYREVRSPSHSELALVERAASLAGIAIERERREDLLASIRRNVNEGIYRSVPNAGFVYVNDAMVRMFGYESADAMLRLDPIVLFVEPERREQLRARLALEGSFSGEEIEFQRRDGSRFWALVSSRATTSADGRSVHFDGAIIDITQRRALEEQLRQAQKLEAVGRLAGGVAHDFNNLLTAISGYSEALVAALPSGSAEQEDARGILQAAERAAALTQQLLAYSRQQVLAPGRHDLVGIVDGLAQLLRRLIPEHIELSTEHSVREVFVHVDRTQIEQVVLNLVLNARDALKRGGRLAISTAIVELDGHALESTELRPGCYARLEVRDDGEGMDELTRQRAFDPFFTTKAPGQGTGLGLSTVHGIVHQSGGLLHLTSALGRGTSVTVYLPCVRESVSRDGDDARGGDAAREGSTEAGAAKPRGPILVVEDEPLVRDIVTRLLREDGFDVVEADDGTQALELARAHVGELALVVTDRVMPRMGGDELAAQLELAHPGTPVLFISGYAEAPPTLGGAAAARGFLRKPFSRSELLSAVRELLARARAGQPAEA